MAGITGREMKIGAALGVTWGTAVPVGVNDGVLLTGMGLKQTIESLKDESFGISTIQNSDAGKIDVPGTLSAYLRYSGLDMLLALVMGTAGVPVPQGGTAARLHKLQIADNIDGLFATVAVKKQSDKVSEFRSVKFTGFTIKGVMNEPVTIDFDCIADFEELSSVVNTAATIATVTYPTKKLRVIPNRNQSFYFRINDKSGAALLSTNDMGISGFELSFKRPFETIYDFKHTAGAEPSQSGFETCQLTLDFPRYDADNFVLFQDLLNATEKKAELYLRGPQISGAYYYYYKIPMPHLRVADPDSTPQGTGRIPAKIVFDVMGTDTAPTGMTCVKPFEIDIMNTSNTDPLVTTAPTTTAPTTAAPTTAAPTTAAPTTAPPTTGA